VGTTTPGVSTKLNPPLPVGRQVTQFLLDNAEGIASAIYVADQDTDSAFELYRVKFATPGVSTKLNPPFPAGRLVQEFVVTFGGFGVDYVADQDTDDVFELYQVNFATPGASAKLNGPLVTGGDVNEVCINSSCS
jgi:hypothetical protein